jgi:hypothetical protein
MEREEQIRQRAYQLWEQDGRPVGREDEHWRRARDDIETAFGRHGPEADDEAEAANERAAARCRGDGAQDLTNSADPARGRQLRDQTGGGLSDEELSLGAGDSGASDMAVSDRTGRAVDQLSGAGQPSPAAGETGSRRKRP